MQCNRCQQEMDEGKHCLVAKTHTAMDYQTMSLFSGYQTQLWRCPKCGTPRIVVLRHAWPLLDLELSQG